LDSKDNGQVQPSGVPQNLCKGRDGCLICSIEGRKAQHDVAFTPRRQPITGVNKPGINRLRGQIVKEPRGQSDSTLLVHLSGVC
jgi:hypothetical protein